VAGAVAVADVSCCSKVIRSAKLDGAADDASDVADAPALAPFTGAAAADTVVAAAEDMKTHSRGQNTPRGAASAVSGARIQSAFCASSSKSYATAMPEYNQLF
jgi:hypothetical protein